MVTTFTIPNVVFRLVILAMGGLGAYWFAWHGTSDLDTVEQRTIYRLAFFLMLMRGWIALWFTMLNVFPLSGN